MVSVGVFLVFAAWSGEWIKNKIIDRLKPEIESRLQGNLAWSEIKASWLTITLDDIRFTPRGSAVPLLRIKETRLRFDFLSLFSGRPKLTEMDLVEPEVAAGVPDSPSIAEASSFLSSWKEKKRALAETEGKGSFRPDRVSADKGRFSLGADGGARLTLSDISFKIFSSGRIEASLGGMTVTSKDGCTLFSAKGLKAEGDLDTPSVIRAKLDSPRSVPCEKTAEDDRRRDAFQALARTARSLLSAGGKAGAGEEGDAGAVSRQLQIDVVDGAFEVATDESHRFVVSGISGKVSRSAGRKAPLAGKLTGSVQGADGPVAIDFLLDPVTGKGEGGVDVGFGSAEWLTPLLARFSWIRNLAQAKAGASLRYSWHEDVERIDARLSLNLEGLAVGSDLLAGETIPMPPVKIETDVYYLPEEARLNLAKLRIYLAAIPMDVVGYVQKKKDEQPERLVFDLTWSMPPVGCEALLKTLPPNAIPHIADMKLDGTIGASVKLAIDKAHPEATELDANLDNRCVVLDEGKIPKPGYFRSPFEHTVPGSNGLPLKFMTGPGSDAWVPLGGVSPYFIWALFVTEDGKFVRHSGMTLPEVKRAVEMNLADGKWTHGASTITMQTAKNLFLDREKTLSRKFEELVLTWWLETHFSKEEIIELYINIIEYGPDLYGIKNAASRYFGRLPSDLDPIESVFLAKLLPAPTDRYAMYTKGEVSEKWMSVLHGVLQIMFKRGYITEDELKMGLEGKLVFFHEGDPLPAPHNLLWSTFSPLTRGPLGTEEEPPVEPLINEN